MTPNEPTDRTTIVVGASRGLGRGIATALTEAGAPVVAVARTESALAELAGGAANITPEVADATDPTVAGTLLDRYEPQALVLVAGATPLMRPLQHQTWETSQPTGTPTSGSRFTGCARRCSNRCAPAAG